ncbi:REPTOR-binding partner isoform X2 [Neocloeon triangulifer]|uniref:REPTOR-binding partner isoform X2 n=1 Tax=Neocloeon triangulifer TaxID=2078957 RepID=UPI00286F76FE|nr:REPTOR-binding partner isoform X2 [Neocloeon triangulifer]
MDFAGFDMMQADNADQDGARGERKESGKRGRKPGRKAEKTDMRAKLERSRQSARECRARKKLRYQYLEELVADREKAVFALREELEKYSQWSKELAQNNVPQGMEDLLAEMGMSHVTNGANESFDIKPSV